MTQIFDALIPVIAMIVAGFLIRRHCFLADSFWPSAERLTYYILMPAMLIQNLANRRMESAQLGKILLTVEGAVLASAVLVTLWWLVNRRMEGPVFTSLFQGGVRFNTFVALALAESLFGRDGLFIAALGAGFMIILINILCVTAFSLSIRDGKPVEVAALARDLAANPLIIGCVVGVGINLLGFRLPTAVNGVLGLAGKAAFPIGLMAVGAAYRAGNLSKHWQPLTVSCVVQFLCKPLLAWWLGQAIGLTGTAAAVAVLLFSVPTAPSAYILSRQMGGDHDSMASIITVQTCISFVTLPVTIALIL